MGSSGAGKTSLLNVLNFRNINNFKINGIVKINGIKVNSLREISKISSFVQQEGN
jgi:ABC-type multidrug transport system ATPase subunit